MGEYERILEYIASETGEKKHKGGGPRSSIVDAIFVLLLSKPMRAAELAREIGVESKYVSSYLSYWKTRGYVEYSNGLWYLTPLGEDYAKNIVERTLATRFHEYVTIARQLLGEKNKRTINRKKKLPEEEEQYNSLSFIVSQTNKHGKKQLKKLALGAVDGDCAYRLLDQGLSPEEKEVLRILVDNYSQWGSSYMYVDQIQEKLSAEPMYILKVLRDLQTKQLIYIYNDPRLGIRVGFTRKIKSIIDDVCRH